MAGPSLAALIESQLPDFVVEDYPLVTNFLSKYYEALSISEGPQDIINNFEKYLDVDTFSPEILVKTASLAIEIGSGTANIDITVDKTDGFPEKSGIIMIDQEIFLYSTKTDTQFLNCVRGYSAKTQIGNLYEPIKYVESNSAVHKQFAVVNNLSNLLLAALIKNYEEQYTSGFPYPYLSDQTNKNLLVKRIKDFYRVKGTPQSLEFIFQMLFSVKPDIIYPKENVYKASESGWNNKELLVCEVISGDIRQVVGNEIVQTPDPYNPELTAASAIIDNIVGEPYQGSLQYTLTISPGSKKGTFAIARRSFLMNDLQKTAGPGDRIDVFSTVGFPDKDGRVIIGSEEITYSFKTATQFIIKERDAVNSDNKQEYEHKKGVRCFTKNNLSGVYLENGVQKEIKLRIYGLVSGLASKGIQADASAGLEYDETADNFFDVAAGGIPYVSFNNMVEFKSSGFSDEEPLTNEWIINQDFDKLSGSDPSNVGTNNIKDKVLSDVSAIYRDADNYYIASSGFPSYAIGPFDNISVPEDQEHLKVIPRKPIDASSKNITTSTEVGVMVNGVPLLNHKSTRGLDFGKLQSISITDPGRNYSVPPSVNIEGNATAIAQINGLGQITAVNVTNPGSGYTSAPTVTFTSGTGGLFTVLIQQGEIANIYLSVNAQAEIIDAGQDYTEPPQVYIYDSSGKGKGALFSCQIDVATGKITGFTKQSGGFDYQDSTTTVTLVPVSKSASATAVLTRWQYNRYLEMPVDNGNAAGVVETANDPNYGYSYGHIISPTSLKILRQDNVDGQGNPLANKSHSPIMGWAYDGNPIYGSFGYEDTYQDITAANPTIKRMESSWKLKTSRISDAPSTNDYSLGRFTNDYEFEERLGDLDANNGRFCTTPEFPEGTYAYFMTSDDQEAPTFPYSIGEAFYNVPVEENWKTKSKQSELPNDVRRRTVNADDVAGELLTSRVSGVEYGPITNVEVHQSSYNFTNEDVLYVDNSINDNGDGLFAAVDQIQGQTVESLTCNTPKNQYFTCDKNVYLNHTATITQENTGATANVIGKIDEDDRFVVKNVLGTFNLTDSINSTTEIYNLTFDSGVTAIVGDRVVYTETAGGVAHEVAIGKVLRNVVDKNTLIIELQFANPDKLTTVVDGITTTIPSSQYNTLGFFATGNGCAVNADAATVVNVRSLSKGFKLLDIESNIAVLKTLDKRHGLAVGDEVIVTVQPDSTISTQKYFVETKKYHNLQLTEPSKTSDINGSGVARLQLINAGSGFTPSSSFVGVNLTNSTGTGSAGTVTVNTDADGHVSSFVIINKGDGYQYGNILTIQSSLLGGNVDSQECTFFVDAAGCAKNDSIITLTSSNGFSIGDIIRITEEECRITNVDGNDITVVRGVNDTEVEDHIENAPVELLTKKYRFIKDSSISFGGNNAYVDSYDETTQVLVVYYQNEGDTIVSTSSTFLDGSTPAKSVSITSTVPTSLRFRFKKDGETEWSKNISLDVQRTYRYLFDTSDASLVNRNLKFYENVYKTTDLVQSFQSTIKPGNTGSFTSFQLGYGIPIDGTTWNSTPVLDIPPKIYYGEVAEKIDAEGQFFTLVEDPFAGKHAVFYGYEYEFAYRLPSTPQNEGFTNVQYYTDSLYAVGAIKRVKVISGGKNYTMPPQVPGVFLNKRFRGNFELNITDGRIVSVTVTDTGLNYSQPVVLLENKGNGANAKFTVELRADGSVSRIIPVQEGTNYDSNTTLRLYESDVKMFAHGDDIGKLATLEIISSGKDFNNDPTLSPQVNPPIVMTLKDMPDKAFLNGELITQRNLGGDVIASARVDYWVDGMNILRLKGLYGKFDKRYSIYGETLRSTANIQVIYVANITPEIGPTSTSVGSYSSDRSKLSAVSQKVQDGVYYQDYSYVVKSTISINDWRDFVKRFTHPAGFNLFGEVLIESQGDGTQPETIDTPQSGIKDNGFGAVISILEPGVLGVTSLHKATRITQSHVRVDSMSKQRGKGTINYSEQNNVEIEVFDLAISPSFDGSVQADGTISGTTTFTLFKKDINEVLSPFRAQQLIVTLDGVLQDPDTAYTISGSTITFASPPLGPYIDAATGIAVPGVTFYGKSMKFQDDANNAEYMREATNITSLFDGTSTDFALGIPVVDGDHLFVSLDGVIQEPDVAYTLTTNPGNGEIKFTEAPRQVGKIVELEIGDATNWLVNDYVVGQTSGARGEIVAKRYFQGNKFLDAANIIDNNASVLAEEAVGILDDTSKFGSEYFQYPGLGRNQCIVDLKSVLRAMADDLIQGGNANTYDAAKEYLLTPASATSDIKHIEGEVEATLWAMKYLKDMTILAVRNKFGIDNLYDYQRAAASTFRLTPTGATYSPSTGTFVLTIVDHKLEVGDFITIADNALKFSCTMGTGDKTYPRQGDPAYRSTLQVTQKTDDTITVNIGTTSNITHTPTAGSYDPATGLMTLDIGSHNLAPNTAVKIAGNSLSFSCEMDDQATVKTYPRTTDPYYDTAVNIVSTGSTFHTPTTASYSGTTGFMTVTVPDHGFENGDKVKLVDGAITFSCTYGGGTHNYVGGTATNAVQVTGGSQFDVTGASYNPTNGDLQLTIGSHSLTNTDTIVISAGSLDFKCDEDNYATTHSYPRTSDPVYNKTLGITSVGGTTITVNVGVSSPGSAYPRPTDPISGKFMPISNVSQNTFDIQVLDTIPSTNTDTHTYVSALTNGVELEKGTITLQVGTTSNVSHNVSYGTYDPVTGDMELTIGNHTLPANTSIKLLDNSLTFSCTEGSGGQYSYPRTDVTNSTATTGTTYNPTTGVMAVTTTTNHGLVNGDWIKFADNSLSLSCDYGTTSHTYVGGTAVNAVASGGTNFNVINAAYNPANGDMVLTIGTHSLSTSDTITITANSLSFTCDADNHATTHTYPRTTDPKYNTSIDIDAVDQGAGTITVNVGAASGGQTKTYPRTSDYASDRWLKVSNVSSTTFEVTVLDIIPSTNTNTHVFVSSTADGISKKKDPMHDAAINIKSVTTTTITINVLNTAPSTNVTPHTYVTSLPGAVISGGAYNHRFISAAADSITSGGDYAHTFVESTQNSIGVYEDPYNIDNPVANTFIDAAKLISDNKSFVSEEAVARMATGTLQSVSDATYTPATGLLELNIGTHSFTTSDFVKIPDNSLIFSCTMGIGNKTYPRSSDPISGERRQIESVTANTLTIDVGASPIVNYDVSGATYNPTTGDMVLTVGSHSLPVGSHVKLADDSLTFECLAAVGTHIYSGGTSVNAITITAGSVLKDVTDASYNPTTGILEMTIGSHSYTTSDTVTIGPDKITFTCDADSHATNHSYPRATDPAYNTAIAITAVTGTTISCNVGVASSNNQSTYPRASSNDYAYNSPLEITAATANTITLNVNGGQGPISVSSAHTFVSATSGAVITGGNYTHTFQGSTAPIEVGGLAIADPYYDDAVYIKYEGTPLTPTAATYAPDTGVVTLTVPTQQFTVTDATYDPVGGDMELTIGTHSLTTYDSIKISPNSISFSCEYNGVTQSKTYPRAGGADYAYDVFLPVLKVSGATITVNVNGGQGAISHNVAHTFIGAGSLGITTEGHGLSNGDKIKIEDLSLTFTCAEDGNSTNHAYPRSTDPISGNWIDVSNVTTDTFTIQCLNTLPSTNETDHIFVSAKTNSIVKQDDVIICNVGKSSNTSPHQFVVQTGKTPSAASYNPTNGVMQLTITEHGWKSGDFIRFDDNALVFRCDEDGQGTDHSYPRPITTTFTASAGTSYDPSTGVLSIDVGSAHNLSNDDWIRLDDGAITFTCAQDTNATQHAYPRYTDYASDRWFQISNASGQTFEINILDIIPSTNTTAHVFVTGAPDGIKHRQDPNTGQFLQITKIDDDTFSVVVNTTLPSSNVTTHVFQSAVPNSVKRATILTGGAYTHTFDRALSDAVTANTGAKFTPTAVTFDPATGDVVFNIGAGHSLTDSNTITIAPNSIYMRCNMDSSETPHSYPRPSDPAYGRTLSIKSYDDGAGTISVFVGKSEPIAYEPTAGRYDPATGDVHLTIGTHRLNRGAGFRFFHNAISLTCGMDSHATVHTYPRASSHDALGDCVDDVKDILEAIVWNLKYGGNNRVWDAADLFIDRRGFLDHIQHQVPEVLNVMGHLKTVLSNVIRNNTVSAVGSHGIVQIKDLTITKESSECAAVESAVDTFVGLIENAVQNPATFESGVTRTIPERWPVVHSSLTANRDLTITVDSIPQCAQIESAINTLFSIVTTTIQEAVYNNNNYLLTLTQDFPNPNRIQVEMTKKEFLSSEDVQSEASLAIATVSSASVIAPGVQQKFFGYKHGKYYKLDSIKGQFNNAQTIFELERGGVPFYAERSQNVVVILNGVIQQNRIAYRIEDNIIVFQEAPSEGSACFILYFYGLDPERILLGFNVEPPGTFKKFFRLTVDQQIVLPLEGADCWVSTDSNGVNHTYVNSFARGRIYKQNWALGSRNLLFVEGVTAQKINWTGGTLSITKDRGASASLLDVNILSIEETTNSDLREKLFNRQDRLKSNLTAGEEILIDGEADSRSIIRAAREALVTSGYDSDTTVGSYYRTYEYEVVINVGAYSGQIEGAGAQAVARIDAELRYHTLTSSRQAGLEFLPNDVVCQYNDQNDINSGIVWQGTVKNYVPARKTVELYSLYLDGVGNTDPVAANFRPGEKVYIDTVAGTECIGLQYLKPGGVNSIVVSKRDNTTYFDNQANWRNDNVLNKGLDRLGGGFIPENASSSGVTQEYDYTSSIYSDDLQPQISQNYREPPVMIFRSQPEVDANGDPVGAPAGGGARANAITVRGEIADIEVISSGTGYRVPPQVLFTRGYFVIRKNPLDIKNLTTFGIEPVGLDGSCNVKSYLDTIFKGGAQTMWSNWASQVPYGVSLVFGNAGGSAYLLNRTSDPIIHVRKILDIGDLAVKGQPEIWINLKKQYVAVSYKGTKVTQTQCTGGVQGISVAMTKFKNTETKLSCNAGAVEKQAGNNYLMRGNNSYSAGSLGPHLNFLQSFKFEIQPQSGTNYTGSYVDGKGNTINYTMGDMTIEFFSDRYPNLTIGDFENPEVYNSQVNDPGDTNNFVFQQGSEIHFGTTMKYAALDNPNGSDTFLVTSTAGFPAAGGSFIIGSAADNSKVEKITYTQAFADRFVGCTRVNPLGVVEKGFSAYDFNTTNVGASVVAGGTVFDSNINYLLFSGASGARSATFAATDLTTYSTVTFSAIRGNGSNGGNAPSTGAHTLMLSYSIDGGTTFIDIGSVVNWNQTPTFDDWNTQTHNIPANAQTATTIIRIYMADSTNTTSDQYGVRLMWFNDANTDSYVAGDYIITADLDL